MKIEIIKFNEDLKMPTKANVGDAGLDCYSIVDFELKPNESKLIPLGFGLNLPYGYMATLRPRSSMNCKSIITQIGTIDSGYRGEIKARFINLSNETYYFEKGDKICQIVIQEIPEIELFFNTRGDKGFGSSGR